MADHSIPRLLLESARQDEKAVAALSSIPDIAELLDLLTDSGLPPPPQTETLDELNPYAVEARYGLLAISGLDRQKTGMTIGQVLAWAEMRID
jgi:hypothetical protein